MLGPGSLVCHQSQESVQVSPFHYFPHIHSFLLLQQLILVLDVEKKVLNPLLFHSMKLSAFWEKKGGGMLKAKNLNLVNERHKG